MASKEPLHGTGAAAALAALAFAVLLGGCASTPEEIPALQSAEAAYQEANATPRIDDYARRAMQQAEHNLERAQSLAKQGEDREQVQHYAFLAQRHVEIAQARLQRALNQEEIENADRRRQELVLAAEERQATAARQRAQQAETQLEATQQELEQTREAAQGLAQELDDLKVKQEERGTVFTLSDVVFDLNSDELNQGGERSVERIANTLKKYPEGRILVEGYTDSTGSAAYNEDLSERRAKSVKQIFVNAGIPANRIAVEGHGENFPVATNDSPQGRQMNRRVEIVVAPEGGQPERRTGS